LLVVDFKACHASTLDAGNSQCHRRRTSHSSVPCLTCDRAITSSSWKGKVYHLSPGPESKRSLSSFYILLRSATAAMHTSISLEVKPRGSRSADRQQTIRRTISSGQSSADTRRHRR
jgi:hypothetical protein